jgi:hypothetical protein
MLWLAYPSRVLVGDWLRTAMGLAIGLGVLGYAAWSPWILAIFGSLTLLFLYFGLRTLQRQMQRIALSDEGLFVRDWRQRALPWDRLNGLRLRFYGTRRQHRQQQGGDDPTGGFLELRLEAPQARVTLDSALPGFALVAWRAARAVRAAGSGFDPVTAGNLLTLGVDPDKDTEPPEMASEWAAAVARP